MDIASKVKNLIETSIIDNGYILDNVLYIKEDGNYYLRIIIDKKGSMNVEDCVAVTHIVDPLLDNIDYITDSYILDVCTKEKGCEQYE